MIHLRTVATELHVRDDRVLAGLVMPYGVSADIIEAGHHYREQFARGAFKADVQRAGEVELTATHPRSDAELPIGITVTLTDLEDGLHGEWRISQTTFGDDVLQLVKDKALRSLSAGFVEGRNQWTGNTAVLRLSASLDHVALVRRGAYPQAQLMRARTGTAPAVDPWRLVLRRRA